VTVSRQEVSGDFLATSSISCLVVGGHQRALQLAWTNSSVFYDKVNAVRLHTAGALEPFIFHVGTGVSMSSFCSVNVDDVITAISHLPDKSSAADPLPVSVMKMVAAELAPFLNELFNRSMSAGHFPATFKEAFIMPAIKKPGLDAMDAQSYRPISNLTVVSKLLERIVAGQLKSYLQSFDFLPSLRSGFRQATQQKLPSSVSCLIYWRQWTVDTLLL